MKAILRRTTTMLCAAVMAVPMALSANARAPEQTDVGELIGTVTIGKSSDYTITIPATFDIKNSGWNEIGDISASGTLENGKKLVVTAASANDWALRSGENEVRYEMMNYEDDSAPATSWEFTDLPASQSIGINVEEYRGKPAGSYTDTVTFTASVESAEYVPQTFTSLSDGDILRVGDTLEVASGGYDFRDDGYSLKAWNAPYTVIRANVEGIGDPTMMPTVTEDVNGAYYVIKGNNNNYFDFKGRLAATDTSDGVIITNNGSYWAINVYEP